MHNVSPTERRRRAVVLRFMLDMRSAWVDEGDPVDLTWVILAILLGQYEQRPLSVSDIASMTRIPRTTVLRHVNALKRQGKVEIVRIGHRTVPVMAAPQHKPVFFGSISSMIKRVAEQLSILDT